MVPSVAIDLAGKLDKAAHRHSLRLGPIERAPEPNVDQTREDRYRHIDRDVMGWKHIVFGQFQAKRPRALLLWISSKHRHLHAWPAKRRCRSPFDFTCRDWIGHLLCALHSILPGCLPSSSARELEQVGVDRQGADALGRGGE